MKHWILLHLEWFLNMLEICNGDYGDHISKLVSSIENGKNNDWRSPAEDDLSKIKEIINGNLLTPLMTCPLTLVPNKLKGKNIANHATGFWVQLYILLKQNAIRLSRDRVLTYMRLSMHFIIAILVGIIFFRIGQDADHTLDNYNLLFFNVMFLMYSAFSATLITFPLEVPVLTREHFNRWYKLRSYYLAKKLADLPVQITATFIYTIIVYYMSGQVQEVKRLALYVLICTAICLVAQKIGYIIGIAMKIQNGVIFGPLVIMPFTIFSGFFVHMNDAQPLLQWLFHISFIKYGFEGIMVAIYGYDRPKMRCTLDYCHFAHPKQLLKEVGMKYSEYWYSISMLLVLYIILDASAFLLLRLRLKQRFYR